MHGVFIWMIILTVLPNHEPSNKLFCYQSLIRLNRSLKKLMTLNINCNLVNIGDFFAIFDNISSTLTWWAIRSRIRFFWAIFFGLLLIKVPFILIWRRFLDGVSSFKIVITVSRMIQVILLCFNRIRIYFKNERFFIEIFTNFIIL